MLLERKSPSTKRLTCLFFFLTLWAAVLAPPTQAQKPASPTHHRRVRHHRAAVKRSVKVWVNTNTGIYHYPGQRWYGATRDGEFMTESAARRRGYRPTHNGQ